MSLLKELQRRKVFQAAALYGAGAWLATEIVRFLLEQFSAPYWTDTALAMVLIAGFPVSMWLAWQFDFSKEGFQRTKTGSTNQKSTIILAVLFLSIATTGLFVLINPPAPARTVAVFPFRTLNPNPEILPYGLGITAELVNRLSRIPNLHVKSYYQPRATMEALGHVITSRYILEGSVRVSDSRIRVMPLLIDNESGFNLWSADFDGKLSDLLEFEEATALRIAEVLNVRLSSQDKELVKRRYTDNPEAYEAYLKGWALLETFHFSEENPDQKLADARKYFRSALELDPYFSIAMAGLSMIDSFHAYFEIGDYDANLASARELADRALSQDSETWESHLALATVYTYQGENQLAVDSFHDSLSLNPQNGVTWCYLSGVFAFMNPPNVIEAEKSARKAIELSPGYFLAHQMLGVSLRFQGRYQEAITAHEYALALNPDSSEDHRYSGRNYMDEGNFTQALAHFNEVQYYPSDHFRISEAHAALGETDAALESLGNALTAGYRNLTEIETSPYFVSLIENPRLRLLLDQYSENQ